MRRNETPSTIPRFRFAVAARRALVLVVLCLAASCGSDGTSDASGTTAESTTTAAEETTTTVDSTTASSVTTVTTVTTDTSDTTVTTPIAQTQDCEGVAAQFVTRGSANADLDDPEVNATCEGDSVIVTSNGIPDYTYIETSPGQPRDRDHTFSFPATPTVADAVTPIPYIGTSAVTLGGIPIFGPTEGTGGDVESLPGILSDCGSHNGPSGFHIHLILTSSETDCLFTPDEVAVEPQLVGYAFDGFPIYTGIDQFTSSWELIDESLFATDTWAAHSYVEGSGDLDECNGRTDEDGNYAYYTTATFPYLMGCYTGVVNLDAAGGGGGGGDAEEGEEGERPERPEGDAAIEGEGQEDRPERPERPADGDEERPEPPADGDDRPEPPVAEDGE